MLKFFDFSCSLAVYSNMIDICMLTLYCISLHNSLICYRRCFRDSLVFSMWIVMSSVNRDSLLFSLSNLYTPFISHSCLIALSRYFSFSWVFSLFFVLWLERWGFCYSTLMWTFSTVPSSWAKPWEDRGKEKRTGVWACPVGTTVLPNGEKGPPPLEFELLWDPISGQCHSCFENAYTLWWDGQKKEEKEHFHIFSEC